MFLTVNLLEKTIALYHYHYCGFIVQSTFPLQHLPICTSATYFDVSIEFGTINMPNILYLEKPLSKIGQNVYFHHLPGLAKYLIEDGKRIVIEPISQDLNLVQFYLIHSVFYAILFQQNRFPLLASGILNHEKKAILFMAPFYGGKSYLLSRFCASHYKPFTDNYTCFKMTESNEKVVAYANNTMMMLDEKDVEESIQGKFKKLNVKPDMFKSKYVFELKKPKAELQCIVLLDENKVGEKMDFKPLEANQAFLKFHEYSPRPQWITEMKKQKENFAYLSKLSSAVPIFQASRPFDIDTKLSFFQMILAELQHYGQV